MNKDLKGRKSGKVFEKWPRRVDVAEGFIIKVANNKPEPKLLTSKVDVRNLSFVTLSMRWNKSI